MKKNKIFLLIIGIVIVIAIIGWSISGLFVTPENHDNFAKCLTEKGATLYASKYCGHCNDQKEMFGESINHPLVKD